MRRHSVVALLLALAVAFGCGSDKKQPDKVGTDQPPEQPAALSGIEWRDRKDDGTGSLYVRLTDGTERLVEAGAINSWFSEDHKTIYYSYRHGKSGYEREGEGIMRYAVGAGESELVFEHDIMVLSVIEVRSKSGRPALVIDAIDGGRGAPEVVVADPDRGRVMQQSLTRFQKAEDGILTLSVYIDKQIDDSDFGQWPRPAKTETFDIDELLAREATRETPNPLPID